jgi:hypothetical protein
VLSVETFLAIAISAGRIATVVAIPVLYVWIGGSVYAWLRGRDPVVGVAGAPLTHVGGLLVGVTLLRFSPHADAYDVDHIFGNSGPWNIDFFTFLAYRANPWAYPWDTLYSMVLSGPAEWARQSLATAFAALGGVLPARSIRISWPSFKFQPLQTVNQWIRCRFAALGVFGRPTALVRGALFGMAAMLWSAYLVVYTINVLYWSLNALNFWALLVTAFIYQKYRHAAHRAS